MPKRHLPRPLVNRRFLRPLSLPLLLRTFIHNATSIWRMLKIATTILHIIVIRRLTIKPHNLRIRGVYRALFIDLLYRKVSDYIWLALFKRNRVFHNIGRF